MQELIEQLDVYHKLMCKPLAIEIVMPSRSGKTTLALKLAKQANQDLYVASNSELDETRNSSLAEGVTIRKFDPHMSLMLPAVFDNVPAAKGLPGVHFVRAQETPAIPKLARECRELPIGNMVVTQPCQQVGVTARDKVHQMGYVFVPPKSCHDAMLAVTQNAPPSYVPCQYDTIVVTPDLLRGDPNRRCFRVVTTPVATVPPLEPGWIAYVEPGWASK